MLSISLLLSPLSCETPAPVVSACPAKGTTAREILTYLATLDCDKLARNLEGTMGIYQKVLLLSMICLMGPGCATIKRLSPIESSTVQARQLTREAEASVFDHDLDTAESKLLAAIERDPADSRSRAVLADVYWSRGQESAAVDQMAKAVDLSEGRDAEHLIKLGQMLLAAGKPDAALRHAEQVLVSDEHRADAWTLKGFAMKQLGRPEDALAAFFRSLTLRNDDSQTRVEIARIYRQSNQPGRALAILGAPNPERQQECPYFPEVCYLRGVLLRELQRPTDAIVALQSAKRSGCDAEDLLLHLAECQVAAGQVLQAHATLAEAQEKCPQDLQDAVAQIRSGLDRTASLNERAVR